MADAFQTTYAHTQNPVRIHEPARRVGLLEPPMVFLVKDRIEALRKEAKTHWLISLVKQKPEPKKPRASEQTRKTSTRAT